MRRGLIVGKFMPLHRGHQHLIDTALGFVDDLTIVVYDSIPKGNYTSMPIEKRLGWITELYPEVENILSRKDILSELPVEVKDQERFAEPYAKDLEFLGKFDYVFSSEKYGVPFAQALGAEHVEVDSARKMLPISGTAIRENLYENRGWLDPVVYRSLIQKVVFVGTESTGKSTLAKRMAQEYETQWVHEYGRELWEEQGLTGSFHDLLKIAQNHYRREQMAALSSNKYLFCDTNPWTTLHWSKMYSGSVDARLEAMVEQTMSEYIWILCTNDFSWVDDGTRELREGKADVFQNQLYADLLERHVPFYSVTGSLESRVQQMKILLANIE